MENQIWPRIMVKVYLVSNFTNTVMLGDSTLRSTAWYKYSCREREKECVEILAEMLAVELDARKCLHNEID